MSQKILRHIVTLLKILFVWIYYRHDMSIIAGRPYKVRIVYILHPPIMLYYTCLYIYTVPPLRAYYHLIAH